MSETAKCMKCEKPATTKITKVTDYDKVMEILLCDEHAQEYRPYLRKVQPGNLVDLLQQLFKQEKVAKAITGGKTPGGPTCSNCGLTFSEYRKTLILGCSDCYSNFEKLLLPDLRRMHGATSHDPLYKIPVEKYPLADEQHQAMLPEEHAVSDNIDTLKQRLQEAILEENFDIAAKLRDEVKTLAEDSESQSAD